MKTILFIATAVNLVLALPQAQKDIEPTPTVPINTTPDLLGPAPPSPASDFLKMMQGLGFDPAKATPDPMGGQCQTTDTRRFCVSTDGNSFHVTSISSAVPESFASGAFPDAIAEDMNGFIGKLTGGSFDIMGLKGIIGDMMGLVDKFGSENRLPAIPSILNVPPQSPSPTTSTTGVRTSSASDPLATYPPPFKASPNSAVSPPVGKGVPPQVAKPGRYVAITEAPYKRTK